MINLIGAYIFSIMLYALYVERAKMLRFASSLERLPFWVRVLSVPVILYLALQHADIISGNRDLTLPRILFTVVSGFTLWMHEAGHIYFRPFGTFMMFFGGTLNELLFPALLGWWARRHHFSVIRSLAVCWIGLNLLRMSFYIADARAMKLPLLGAGDSTGHDWNNMLGMLALLESDHIVAAGATGLGCGALTVGMALLIWPRD